MRKALTMRTFYERIKATLRGDQGLSQSKANVGIAPEGENNIVSSYLSAPIPPSRDFTGSLEERLMTEPALAMQSLVNEDPRNAFGMRILKLALPAGAIAAALIAVVFISLRSDDSSPPLHAAVISDSAQKLFELDTLSYHVSVEAEQGVCFTITETVGTRVVDGKTYYDWTQREKLPPETQATYGCLGSFSKKNIVERGVYDLSAGSFSAESRAIGKVLFPVDEADADRFQSERMYVDGSLYVRQAGGTWNRIPTDAVWKPFAFGTQGDGQVPVADAGQLNAEYENIEIVGIEELNGVEVVHYRASRNLIVGEETIDAWIGLTDGLPHKASIVMTALEHDTPLHWQYPGERRTDVPPLKWDFPAEDGWVQVMDGLVIIAHERIPSAPVGQALYSYTYEFSDFNEPVSIVAPLP